MSETIKNKELPLKTTKEPKFLTGGTCADVFSFVPEKGVEYVYKELFPRSRIFEVLDEGIEIYPGNTLEEKAASMKKFYEILREYLGDKIAKTFYCISGDRFGRPCVMIIQEKIKGKTFEELTEEKDRIPEKATKQYIDVKDFIIPRFQEDIRLKEYENAMQELRREISCSENIMVTENGDIKIIDW